MPSTLSISLPASLTSQEARHIITTLEQAGGEPRFVGGCVRDTILGQPPGDIDIATSLRPETVIKLLSSPEVKVIPTGLEHGTVTAVMNKKPFEITTLRRDMECFGRHAIVEYTDNFEEDAARRDFTINAMYCDLAGNIYDYFDGYTDLLKGVVRFVGNAEARVQEDFLRSLRFFRFFARFGKPPMDMEALAAITLYAASLASLSGERVQKEMLGLLAVPRLDNVMETMAESRVLDPIALPCKQFTALNELLMLEEKPYPLQRLAILLRTLADPPSHAHILAERWRLSNRDKAILLQLVSLPSQMVASLSLAEQKKCLRTVGKALFMPSVEIAWAEFLAKEKRDGEKLDPAFSRMLDLAETWDIPVFPIKGKDLLELGFSEGKQVGEALTKAENWWEAEDYRPSRAEVLAYIKNTNR